MISGMALSFILRNNFKTDAGLRPGAKKIAVLITDGKSQDDINVPSDRLKEEGVEIFAVGEYQVKRQIRKERGWNIIIHSSLDDFSNN